MSIFALVDCNNFYVSCERVFNPRLEKKPVLVLSNNDGCAIARSNEVKKMGIPMGAPFFKWKKFCEENNVTVLSSNYELYGDMSDRVMNVLQSLSPDMEIYSIDEAFLKWDGMSPSDLLTHMLEIRKTIKQWVGIPVSIGYAPTKTLAKVANHIAKTQMQEGVFDLIDPVKRKIMLEDFPLEKIWGVGRQLSVRLKKMNIHNAQALCDSDPKKMRHYFSVVMERMVQELRGFSCLGLETPAPRKQIISSRSFGKPVTQLQELEEAVSHYAATASVRLREQGSVARGISVFLQTNRFSESQSYYGNSVSLSFPIPTNDTAKIIALAKEGLRHLFKSGYRYKKAGIMLLDLRPTTMRQYDFFNSENPKREILMRTLDTINEIYGKNTVYHAAQGVQREWQMKFEHRTPRYTTRWSELLLVN